MSLEHQDRLTIGRARARLRDAIRQLDLALERGDDEQEACLRVGAAALEARDGADVCRRLFRRLDSREGSA